MAKKRDSDCRVPLLQDQDWKRISYPNNFNLYNSGFDHSLSDYIACIFVVAFDVRAGNVIEWQLPNDYDLSGIEFKALASGLHTVSSDFIYFKKDRCYGYSYFESMNLNNKKERGIRMKSLGILGSCYAHLPKYHSFLVTQLKHLLNHPNSYEELIRFYLQKEKKQQHMSWNGPNIYNLLNMKISDMAGSFWHFINFFGVKIMLLWKLALLRKKILFFSPPPIGIACYRVYSTCCLVIHNQEDIPQNLLEPLFFINVADISMLDKERQFVACTTEKIFETKTYLYDSYVDNQNIKIVSPNLTKQLTVNSTDKHRFNELCKFKKEFKSYHESSGSSFEEDNEDEINWFKVYFLHMNNLLFSTLTSVAKNENNTWTKEHMKLVNLHPVNDLSFVSSLIECYGLDINLANDRLCCNMCL